MSWMYTSGVFKAEWGFTGPCVACYCLDLDEGVLTKKQSVHCANGLDATEYSTRYIQRLVGRGVGGRSKCPQAEVETGLWHGDRDGDDGRKLSTCLLNANSNHSYRSRSKQTRTTVDFTHCTLRKYLWRPQWSDCSTR